MAKSLMYSGRDLMSFSPLRTLATRTIFTLADWLGFWRFPADLDIDDLASYWHMAYWFYPVSYTHLTLPTSDLV